MKIDEAVRRVQGIAAEIIMRENHKCLPAEMREEARADRVALEIVCEWAMKVYEKDEETAEQILKFCTYRRKNDGKNQKGKKNHSRE